MTFPFKTHSVALKALTLVHVTESENRIDDADAKALGDSLDQFKAIKMLDLAGECVLGFCPAPITSMIHSRSYRIYYAQLHVVWIWMRMNM